MRKQAMKRKENDAEFCHCALQWRSNLIRQTVKNARECGATGDQAAKRQIKNTMHCKKYML